MQREAGVRIGEVAAWMRKHATGAVGDVPEAPDLSEAMAAIVQAVWAAAWKRAAEQVDEVTAVALDAAQTGEADALGAAEKDAAVAARDRVTDEAQQLRREVGQLRAQLDTAHRELDQARAPVEQADRARVRDEASSDTLREVLDTLYVATVEVVQRRSNGRHCLGRLD